MRSSTLALMALALCGMAVAVSAGIRPTLDAALVYAWYLQPADIRDGYCGNS